MLLLYSKSFKNIQTALNMLGFTLCNTKLQVFKNKKLYIKLGNYRKSVDIIELITCPIKYFDKWKNSDMFTSLLVLEKRDDHRYILELLIQIKDMLKDIKILTKSIPDDFLQRHYFKIKL